jgi:acetylornithine deacetylase/succinyl-diaminopimelate desuccinylase-like protein
MRPMKPAIPIATAIALLLGAAASPTSTSADAPQRPDFPFTTEVEFSAAAVPPYPGDHPEIYAHIEEHQEQHLENLRRWLRQPSISAEGRGIAEMAAMVQEDLRRIGFQEVEIVPTSGHPAVWGHYDAGADVTLAVYMMYDVQPVEPADWQVDPFAGEIVDHPLGRALMARGATNQKGPQRALLNALEAIVAVTGTLPVNLMVVAEGEEELGSPHLPEVIDRYEDRLQQADGVLFPANSQDPAGAASMFLGVKGIVYFELESQGGEWGGPGRAEIHGSLKAIVDSPVWRLVQALASLTTADSNTIAVPGYYDPIRPPSEEEQQLVNGMLEGWQGREERLREVMGVSQWIDDLSGRDALVRSLFDTTLNINGIWGGYTGEGVMTILPHRATAKVDSRLVPDQRPEQAVDLIRAHLDAQGFSDVELRVLGGYPPAQTSVTAPLVQAAIGVFNKHVEPPTVAPRIGGSAPYYLFTERLALPMVAGGLGHGSGAHAPNEYMVVDPAQETGIAGLAEIEKAYVDLLYALAAAAR